MSATDLGEALRRAASVLSDAGIEYALMGGMASALIGRNRATTDIDLFLAPKDAVPALRALACAGFATQRTDEAWLYKAWWRDAMVDLIFKSKGGIQFDREMRERRRLMDVNGVRIPALAPEDLLLIKVLASAEHAVRHWYDALAVLAGGEVDWEYLLRRSRHHPNRMLSLLCYAVSEGIDIPPHILRSLFEMGQEHTGTPAGSPGRVAQDQLAARVREALATDPVLGEPHLSVDVTGGRVLLQGRVATASRRSAAEWVARRLVGGRPIENRIEVVR
jgi:predicted nucleotidyltransferase